MATTTATERDASDSALGVRPPGFVARDTELTRLAAALAQPPAVVLVEGEAGIGKTRLIQEFLASSAGNKHKTLIAWCPPFRQPHTLGPVADAVRRAAPGGVRGLRLSALAGALRPLFPEWATDLPAEPEPTGDASAARHRVFAALAELLDRLHAGLLIAEDVHWADEATIEFLLYLATEQSLRVCLVATYRPEDTPHGSPMRRLARLAAGSTGLRLALGPLDVTQTARLVTSMLGGEQVSEGFATFVHQRTEGVPLAVEESVRVMAQRGDVSHRRRGWMRRPLGEIEVPPTIRDAVLERIGRLSPDGAAVIRAAAVLADPAPDAVLAVVADLPTECAQVGLAEALSCGLLTETMVNGQDLASFHHVLAAQAVHESIPSPQRRVMHSRAAAVLKGLTPLPLARLARHSRHAGQIRKWSRYAEQAANLALAAGDEATAAVLLHEVVTGSGLPGRELARLTSRIPLVSLPGQGRRQELVLALRAVLDTHGLDLAGEADVRFQLGRVLLFTGERETASAELGRAIPLLGHDPVSAARAMTLLGMPYMTDKPVSEHLRWLRQAAELSTVMASSTRLILLMDRVCALLLLGEERGWAEAAGIPSDAPSAPDRLQIARGYLNLGEAAMLWGRYNEAREWLTQARDLAECNEYLYLRLATLLKQAHLDWFAGAWTGLAERARLMVDDDALLPAEHVEATLIAGLLDAAGGAQAQARRLLLALEGERQRGAVEYWMAPAAALARLALADGNADDALQVTEEPVHIVGRKGIWLWAADIAPARVEALAAAGRIGEAEDLVTAFAGGLRGRKAPAPKAALALCRAILAESRGQPKEAAALFARAAVAWDALPRPYDALLARERQARSLLSAGQAEAALSLLSGLRQELTALGALGDADRVVSTLREHGVTVKRPQRGGWRSYGTELSPREREVVSLLVSGRSDRAIAEALFLSPRTVARHLESARHKLGVSSRTALAVSAVEGGIVPGEHHGPGH